MRLKSYILIVLLAVLGVLSLHKNQAPNQEIVIQFHDVAIHSDAAQSTIAGIKAQLEHLGVTNIKIKDQENGTLHICYHSEKAIADVRKTFSEDEALDVDVTASAENQEAPQSPVNDHTLSYKLDIFEIQKQDPNHLDLNGVSVPVLKLKTEHFFEPNKVLTCHFDDPYQLSYFNKNTPKPADYSAKLKRHVSQRTPQVRAGPNC
ncbi:hypothetical protein [Gaetbulibacter aestuarii]|uniref:HMA domain-containing protein n=1 Tax=Gaetbulibacter aestuarii TaxID=1502358 RepID=A0ABW7N1E4_9FLAO